MAISSPSKRWSKMSLESTTNYAASAKWLPCLREVRSFQSEQLLKHGDVVPVKSPRTKGQSRTRLSMAPADDRCELQRLSSAAQRIGGHEPHERGCSAAASTGR